MRKVLMTAAIGLLVLTGTIHAQTLTRSGAFNTRPTLAAPCALGVGSITQSADCAVEMFAGIMCSAGGNTSDTSTIRRFFLTADDGIVSNYTVTSVDFGVEVDVPDPNNGNPLTVNIYSIPIGAAFLFGNMTLEGTTTIDLDGSNTLSIVNAIVGGTIDPSTDDLVVELLSFDHLNSGGFGQFFPGANSLGQTQPSYIAAADCSIFEPTNLADVGFPDSHNVMVVNGFEDTGCEARVNASVRSSLKRKWINYDVTLTHNKGDVSVPIFVELRDTAGNVLAVKDHGLMDLARGQSVALKGTIEAVGLTPGYYLVVARIEGMAGFREIKKLIQVN